MCGPESLSLSKKKYLAAQDGTYRASACSCTSPTHKSSKSLSDLCFFTRRGGTYRGTYRHLPRTYRSAESLRNIHICNVGRAGNTSGANSRRRTHFFLVWGCPREIAREGVASGGTVNTQWIESQLRKKECKTCTLDAFKRKLKNVSRQYPNADRTSIRRRMCGHGSRVS